LEHCSARYVAGTAPTAFVRLSESIDLQALDPERIDVPVTVVAVAEDQLVPLDDAQQLAARLHGPSRLHVLRSRFGHDAFLKETAAIAAVLRSALADDCAGAA
ncbi:MAG: homoserine O-succinyltransferase, partial [Gammaproteobacteria bacterium]|nr:homoserine O-succinyltransferase [Gammaproteobacteria bacterium]